MTYRFARVERAVAMPSRTISPKGKRWWVRLHEKGGKRHEMPGDEQPEVGGGEEDVGGISVSPGEVISRPIRCSFFTCPITGSTADRRRVSRLIPVRDTPLLPGGDHPEGRPRRVRCVRDSRRRRRPA